MEELPESTIYSNIRKILVRLALEGKLPEDWNGFDAEEVLKPAIEPLLTSCGHILADNESYIEAVNSFNHEMFNEDNFQATIDVLTDALNYKLK